MGIDPGLATTGYAVIESHAPPQRSHQGLTVLEAGVIRTSPDDPLPRRLKMIYKDVERLIDEYRPDALAVEEVFFNQNVTTAMTVSQARGVVLLAGSELAEVESYTPLQIKRQICGYGRAKKLQIQAMVQRLLNLKVLPRPDDAADALAVALCLLLRHRSGLRSAQTSEAR